MNRINLLVILSIITGCLFSSTPDHSACNCAEIVDRGSSNWINMADFPGISQRNWIKTKYGFSLKTKIYDKNHQLIKTINSEVSDSTLNRFSTRSGDSLYHMAISVVQDSFPASGCFYLENIFRVYNPDSIKTTEYPKGTDSTSIEYKQGIIKNNDPEYQDKNGNPICTLI